MAAQVFNPNTLEAEQMDLSDFEASLVYTVSGQPARARQKNSSGKKNPTKPTTFKLAD